MLHPEAVGYLVQSVNGHPGRFQGRADDERRRLEQQLEQVEAELANVQKAILAGLVAETTAALLKGSRGVERGSEEALRNLANQRFNGPLRIDAGVIKARIAKLDDVLRQDADAANAFLPRASEDPLHPNETRRETVLWGVRRGERLRNHQKPGPSPGF